jgi:hypothetical protein
MPCDGIAVMTATATTDLGQHFAEEANRQAFSATLAEQGLKAGRWWYDPYTDTHFLNLSAGANLGFDGRQITLQGSAATLERPAIVHAFALAQAYGGLALQGQVVGALAALGLAPQNLAQDARGTVVFTLDAGLTVRVKIHLDGKLELITTEGDFESGKTTLEALLGALQARGVDATLAGQVETHRHDLAITTTGEGTARLQVHEAITETGAPHTH